MIQLLVYLPHIHRLILNSIDYLRMQWVSFIIHPLQRDLLENCVGEDIEPVIASYAILKNIEKLLEWLVSDWNDAKEFIVS